jgi:hypothetical protein
LLRQHCRFGSGWEIGPKEEATVDSFLHEKNLELLPGHERRIRRHFSGGWILRFVPLAILAFVAAVVVTVFVGVRSPAQASPLILEASLGTIPFGPFSSKL